MNPAYILSKIKEFKEAMEKLPEPVEEDMDEGSFYC